MRKKQILVILLVFTFVNVSAIALFATATAVPAAPAIDYGPEAIDATPEMLGEDELAMREYAAEVGAAVATGASLIGDPAVVGTEYDINVSDFVYGVYEETFKVIMDGTYGIILLAYESYNATTDEYVFANPSGTWRDEDRISTAMLSYLLDQFDSNIYPAVTGVFGDLIPRGDEGQKVWVLIHNIRDEAYYGEYEYYVAGYFSSSENAENNKNMFHIDSYDWQHRVGTPLNDWFLNDEFARPNLYEGTFAHEFEHMVHFDVDPDEPSWVDEGLADLASFLSGYGHSDGHIRYYFERHFYTPLTFWGGGLEDYGASYLFQLYLYDHYGGAEFISDLVKEQANGIEGIENTLRAHGYCNIDFDEIFDRWTIANYIDEKNRWNGKYGYESIEIGSADTRGWTIEFALADWDVYLNWYLDYYFGIPDVWPFPTYEAPFEVNEDAWQFALFGYPMPYTAQYFRFTNEKLAKIRFDGADTSDILPPSGSYEWYSDVGAWAWNSLNQSFSIPATGATLNFKTFYDIEEDWDYGYVEVFNGTDWFTLDATGTVDDLGNPQMSETCPDEREPMTYEAAGRWHGFTGNSGGWIDVSMDLTPFAGQDIDLYFTTWQDGAFTLVMMYVDDISIPELGFFDGVEAGEAGWTTTGWEITNGIYPNGWSMNVIKTKNVTPDIYPDTDDWKLVGRDIMRMKAGSQSGNMLISRTPSTGNKVNVAIVSNHADHIIASNYHFDIKKKAWNWRSGR